MRESITLCDMATTHDPDPVRAYADEAVALLAHVESVEDLLDDLKGSGERSRNAAITDAHNEIGSTLKLADVYSNLAIAEAVDKLRLALDPARHGTRYFAEGDPHR